MRRSVIVLRRAAKPFSILGSALMRGVQLPRLAAPHLTDRYRIRLVPFHAGLMPPWLLSSLLAGAGPAPIIIFTKTATKGLTPDHIDMLRSMGAIVGLDSVDLPLDGIDFPVFDFQIAASLSAEIALKARLRELGLGRIPVGIVHHHFDPRLMRLAPRQNEVFRSVYVGMPENAEIPTGLRDEVDVFHTKTGRDFGRVLKVIDRYTLHYAVRPEGRSMGGFKPFTKGFTAAACRANILVSRSEDDAEHLLGADYPYFVSTGSNADIEQCFEMARTDFGGPVWKEAQHRVHRLEALVQPARLAEQLHDIIDQAVQART